MNKLSIQLAENRTGFRPGELLRGTAEWQLAGAPAAIEVRLCWFVEVQGIAEVRRVQTVRFDRPPAAERREFEFQLPEGPYSFVGTLATLGWAAELVVLPNLEFTQVFFNLGPRAPVVILRQQLQPAAEPTVDQPEIES